MNLPRSLYFGYLKEQYTLGCVSEFLLVLFRDLPRLFGAQTSRDHSFDYFPFFVPIEDRM
jgi:hypothetical protein